MKDPVKTGCTQCPGIKQWVAEMAAQPGFMNTDKFWATYRNHGKKPVPYLDGEPLHGFGFVAHVPGLNGYLLRVPGEFCPEHKDRMLYLCYRGNVELK